MDSLQLILVEEASVFILVRYPFGFGNLLSDSLFQSFHLLLKILYVDFQWRILIIRVGFFSFKSLEGIKLGLECLVLGLELFIFLSELLHLQESFIKLVL